ncbi:helix-turn-helix domain-containing protein [Actinoplanes regularis]|uniref:AraC-like ligand-binding domain-containing protein n=1 Tax=Actinoplanes regularis TaxID=52697 RepID=UPI002553B807|nr:helix-turn-helix domain-containing protein [Actinoplanes regularis]
MSTAVAKDRNTVDLWRQYVLQTCGALQVIPGPGFVDGSITTTTLGDLRLAVIRADPHSVFRQPSFANSERGHIYVTTVLRGRCVVRQDDTEVAVRPGDVATFDSSRPYALHMDEPFEMVSVRTRHQVVGLTEDTSRLVSGSLWHGTTGVGALAHRTLESVGRLLADLNASISEPIEATLNGVVSALFAERLSGVTANPVATRQLLLLRIRRYAEHRLHNPALTPRHLADHCHVSLRYLQMLFAEQGTSPARWIREERLARLHTDLTDPRLDHLSVAALGERWGLADASQVSRLFRLHYGLSPTELRRTRCRDLAPAA